MITVISKHLGVFYERWPIEDKEYFGAIHYVEQLRYRGERFIHLCANNIIAPAGFNPGIEVKGEELNHLYSRMVIWFELESFIKNSKSFQDHLWRVVAKHHPDLYCSPEVKNQKYILQAFNKLKTGNYKFKSSRAFEAINGMLDVWGRYLVGFRNYIEYTEPLGGMLSSTAGRIEMRIENSKTTHDICLPDKFPTYGENKDTFQFKFASNIMANSLVSNIIKSIDDSFPDIVREIHNKSLQPSAKSSG